MLSCFAHLISQPTKQIGGLFWYRAYTQNKILCTNIDTIHIYKNCSIMVVSTSDFVLVLCKSAPNHVQSSYVKLCRDQSSLVMFGHVWSCLVMFSHVQSCLFMFIHVYSCLFMFSHVQSCLVVFSFQRCPHANTGRQAVNTGILLPVISASGREHD